MANHPPAPPAEVPFRVLRIDHAVLRVRDLAGMTAFYEQALGFSVERTLMEVPLVQLRAGESLLDLTSGPVPAGAARNMDHLCFRIDGSDWPALAAHLARFGVATEMPKSRYGAEGSGPSIYFQDPEGNRIELKGPPGPRSG